MIQRKYKLYEEEINGVKDIELIETDENGEYTKRFETWQI